MKIFVVIMLCMVCIKFDAYGITNTVTKNHSITNISEDGVSASMQKSKNVQPSNENKIYAVYMQNMLRPDAPYFDAVDRIAMKFSGNSSKDLKKVIETAQSAGIDGFLMDLVPCRKESHLDDYRKMYNIAKDMNFKLIPMIDTPGGVSQSKEQVADFIKSFLSQFPAGTDTVDGKPLFFSYNTPFFTPMEWRYIYTELKNNGYSIYYLANLRFLNKPNETVQKMCDKYLPVGFGGLFNFYPTGDIKRYRKSILFHRKILDAYQPDMKLAASINSWFWRASIGLFIPRPGTEHYRSMWEGIPLDKLDYISISTWNDFSENHQVQPTLYLGHTKLDLTRYYSDKLKGLQHKLKEHRATYITYRQSVLAGEILSVEVLNLPNKTNDYYALLQIRDKDGNVLLNRKSKTLSAGKLQAEQFTIATADIAKNKRLISLYLEIRDANKTNEDIYYKYIGTVFVQPVINRDFRKISKMLDDIPDFKKLSLTLNGEKDSGGIYINNKLKSAKLEIKSDKIIKHIDLMRNRLDVLCKQDTVPKNTQHTVKLTLMSTRKYTADKKQLRTPWNIAVNVEDAVISDLDYLSVDSKEFTTIRKRTDTSIAFDSSTDAMIYPISFGLSFCTETNAKFNISLDGEKFSFSLQQLKQQRILELVLKNRKKRVDIEITDEISETHLSPINKNEYKISYNPERWLQKHPIDYYYSRIFMDNERRSWIDTTPIPVRCNNSDPVERNAFDQATMQPYKTAVYPEETLIGFWNFDNQIHSGSIMYDSSYYHFDGRYRGGSIGGPGEEISHFPSYTNGVFGDALSFNGKNDYILLPPRITPAGSFALELWIKPTQFGRTQTLFANQRFSGHHGSVILRINKDGFAEGLHKNSADTKAEWDKVSSHEKLIPNTWNHLALNYNGHKLSIFINGKLEAETACSGIGLPAVPIIGAEFIDGGRKPSNYFCGQLDEVKLWGISKPTSYYQQEYKLGISHIPHTAK